MNIALIGFMGVGKTTVSRALAKLSGMPEADVDRHIVEKEGRPIPEIFASDGEAAFRDMETAAIRELCGGGRILSCGGGAVLRPENVKLLKENGVIVLLTAGPETVLKRVGDGTSRPALGGVVTLEHIAELMERRRAAYEAAADLTVATDGRTPEEIAEEILGRRDIMSEALAQTVGHTEKDYYDLPENVRSELIDGQFYDMTAPNRMHQKILNFLNTEINIYIRAKKGVCEVYPAPFAVRLFEDNDKTVVEPDISVICDPDKLTDRGCTGAPDWIIEIISPSPSSHDYVRKLNLYLNAGVREYWIVDPRSDRIFVYHLEKADFEVETYSFRDKIKVHIYDDLSIDFQKLWS